MATLTVYNSTGISLTGIDWVFSPPPGYVIGLAIPTYYDIFDPIHFNGYSYGGQNFTYTGGVLSGGTVNFFYPTTNTQNYSLNGFSTTLAEAAAVGNGRPLLELILKSSD